MNLLQHPAHIIIGAPEDTVSKTLFEIQKIFCPNQRCAQCFSCKQIAQRQHYAIQWFFPEAYHTVASLEPLFETITYALDPSEHYFLVLERADALHPSAAHRLLKSLEEPPAGYHFIFLTSTLDMLLPTIVSRCLVHQIASTPSHTAICSFFTADKPDFLGFVSYLEKFPLSERDVIFVLDSLEQIWSELLKKEKGIVQKKIMTKIIILHTLRECLPMPGSSKFFLRELFLQIYSYKESYD